MTYIIVLVIIYSVLYIQKVYEYFLIIFFVESPDFAAGAIMGFTAIDLGLTTSTDVIVSWPAVENRGGNLIVHYSLQYLLLIFIFM